MRTDLVARAKRLGTPLIDGERVTFVWRGKRAPQLMGDFNAWAGENPSPFKPLNLIQQEPGVWTLTLEFPRNAYIEYSLLASKGRTLDPLNARTTPNGVGGVNNFFYMPDAAPTPWTERQRGVLRGRVTTHTLDVPGMVLGNARKIHLYQPPTAQAVALVVALDGQDYLRRAQLPTLLDNLIAQNKIRPVAVAMVESSALAKGSARMAEYALNELTLLFVLKHVLPLAQKKLRLVNWKQAPGAYAVMGASMGGLMSLFVALRTPQVFGAVISHAGAFELWNSRPFVFDLAALAPTKTTRVWLDVGRLDWLLGANRRMKKWLREQKYDVQYREYYAYHNWPAWRDVLPDALLWAFPAV
ncbi:MAG: prolyl oligopeptidase family serine peptidase [Chloroflexi bacterium]|nr:prolyl oligopeptidase family serine peptidase [Chloroflexota bacterium]